MGLECEGGYQDVKVWQQADGSKATRGREGGDSGRREGRRGGLIRRGTGEGPEGTKVFSIDTFESWSWCDAVLVVVTFG